MLSGIFCGAMYGGSTTSILLNIPGEAASICTCLDGYQMARKGQAGTALGMSALGSFLAGTIALVGLTVLAPPLASFALKFGPEEYGALILFGLISAVYLSQGSVLKGSSCLRRAFCLGRWAGSRFRGRAIYLRHHKS